MEIQIRRVCGGKYREVIIVNGDTTVSLGLNDAAECMTLAKTLKTAIWELLSDDREAYEALMADE